MNFWDSWYGFAAGVVGIIVTVFLVVFGCILAASEWNKHNAPLAFAQCAKMCGPSGVHKADPDFKCECNETRRFEGSPSLDLNIRQRDDSK